MSVINVMEFFIFFAMIPPFMYSIKYLKNHGINPLCIVSIVHFWAAGVPLVLGLVFVEPNYINMPGFYVATKNTLVTVVYCFFVVGVSWLFWYMRGGENGAVVVSSLMEGMIKIKRYTFALFALLLLPIFYFIFVPNSDVYAAYGMSIFHDFTEQELGFNAKLSLFTSISVVSFVLLSGLYRRNFILLLVVCSPVLMFDFWVNGKRAIVATFVLLLFISDFVFGEKVKIKRLGVWGLVFLGFLLYSNWYQDSVRGLNEGFNSSEIKYQDFRVDYFRDQRIKMAVFAEVYPDEMRILEYRGQSIIFLLTAPVARDVWPDKPYPYAQYFTSALYGVPPKLWGWGMTTSWLDECISNFGLIGLFIGPLSIIAFCRAGMKSRSPFLVMLTSLLGSLFLMLQAIACMPLLIVWLGVIIFGSGRKVSVTGGKLR